MAKIERDTLLQRHIDDVVALILDGLRDTANDVKPSEAPPARYYLLGMRSDYRPHTLLRTAPVQGHAVFDFAEWQRPERVTRRTCRSTLKRLHVTMMEFTSAWTCITTAGGTRVQLEVELEGSSIFKPLVLLQPTISAAVELLVSPDWS
jgi:hypothetical protein